jgi:predicted DNA-binding transcriptional regulator
MATVQFFVNNGETGYVVTYATPPKLMKRYAREFAASAQTLRQADQG